MKRFILLLIMAGAIAFAVFGLNFGGNSTPVDPVLDTAAQTKVEQTLRPAAEVTVSEIPYSQFEQYAENGEVLAVRMITREGAAPVLYARLNNGAIVKTVIVTASELPAELNTDLQESDVTLERTHVSDEGGSGFGTIIMIVVIGAILLFVLPMLLRGLRGGGMGGGAAAPGTNGKAGSLVETPNVRLADVGGIAHVKPQVEAMIKKMLDTGEQGQLGGTVPKGFLLQGPPGTGKTLLARAVAGEINAQRTDGKKVGFVSTSGSKFVEMYVGVGAQRVRELFALARKNAPCVIFIDEIDAVGKKRSNGGPGGGGNDEREQTLNEILVQIDGFEASDDIIVIAATNRAELLDDALTRPGRFDRKVSVPLPDMVGREEILNIHANNLKKRAQKARVTSARKAQVAQDGTQPQQGAVAQRIAGLAARGSAPALPEIFSPEVDFATLARETPGCSGADLAEILKRAAEIAENNKATVITMADIRNAFQSLRLGDEMPRKLEFFDEFSTSVHEIVGHALVAGHNRDTLGREHADDVQTVTITPRGFSLGAVWTAPTKDRVSQSQKYLLGRLQMTMAGQIAEKLYLGPDAVTSGASSDIQQATRIASEMVSKYAMTDSTELTFRDYNESNGYSVTKAKADRVDEEIDQLLKEQYIRAEALMLSYAQATDADGNNLLEMLTRAMLVKKTLQGEQFMRLIRGEVVFDRNDLDLGANETEFMTLWNSQAGYRKSRTAAIRKDYAAIAKACNL